ncbi:MAG: DUF3883 domain-containing protein [Chloroflexi bacterium]|nr:DUF3883 domain-containing protein [Chloroflexota bacterium]
MKNTFDNISYKQVKTLLKILISSKGNDLEFIQRAFEEKAQYFENTQIFLEDLDLISVKSGEINLDRKTQKFLWTNISDDNSLKRLLLKRLLDLRNVYSTEILIYLKKFEVSGENIVYKPTSKNRIKDSGIRNLFIELELVQFGQNRKTYRISDNFFSIFSTYLQNQKMSPKELQHNLRKKQEIGDLAEKEIIKYEKKRLSHLPELSKKIVHVSLNDVTAGFDIISFDSELFEGDPVMRYIEVKAVSKYDMHFYWSRNEIETAKEYSKRYFLYLLPVMGGNLFDINNLMIIKNPINPVFNNTSIWGLQEEQYKVFRRNY